MRRKEATVGDLGAPQYFELTREEYEEGKRLSLERLGLTYEELEAMARDRGGNFTSAAAHGLWVAIGGDPAWPDSEREGEGDG